MTDKEARRARRQEIIRERRKAINKLRASGMSDEEIAEALGGLVTVEDEFDDVVDAEVVSVDESESDIDARPIANGEEPETRAVVSLRPVGASENHRETSRPNRYSEEWWAQASLEQQQRRCKAHSTRHGGRCGMPALRGAAVCRYHGGAAPHVKQAARVRLEMAADRMAANLLRLGTDASSEAVQLGATNSALDRVGISKPAEVVVSPAAPKPWEEVFESFGTSSRAESRARRGLSEGEFDVLRVRSGEAMEDNGFDDVEVDDGEGDSEYVHESYYDTSDYDDKLYTPDGGLSAREPHDFDRPSDQPGPRRFGREMTAEDAVAVANRANMQAGSLRAIESPHKRYRRP